MIDRLNRFFRSLDYHYNYILKKIRYFFKYNIKIDLPYFIKYYTNIDLLYYGKYIKRFFFYKLYISYRGRYKKIMWTIFKYPRYYNNFKFKEYLIYNIIKDYKDIIYYYSNIFSYNR